MNRHDFEAASNAELDAVAKRHGDADAAGNSSVEVTLNLINAADFEGQPIPEREWHVSDLIPAGIVTMLGGDGGAGKSLLAMQLAVATALPGIKPH